MYESEEFYQLEDTSKEKMAILQDMINIYFKKEEALNYFLGEGRSIIQETEQLLYNVKTDSLPEHLHHYCSLATCIEIIKNQELWLSAIDKMNDISETTHINELLYRALDILTEQARPNDNSELVKDIRKLATIEQHGYIPFLKNFACCFSTVSNLLSQWRNYADRGRGVSISFESTKIPKVLTLKDTDSQIPDLERKLRINITPATYDDDKKKEIIQKWLKFIFKVKNPLYICMFLGHFKGYMKHKAFSEELEWRLITRYEVKHDGCLWCPNNMQYRNSARGLIPYLILPLDENDPAKRSISHINLGPQNETSIADMKSFLSANKLGHIDVRKSTIPYKD